MNTQWNGGTATFDPDGAMGPAPAKTFRGTYGGGFTGGDGDTGVDLMQGFLNLTYAWKTADDRFALGASAILAIQRFQARGVPAYAPYTKTYIESYMTTGQPKMPQNLSGNGHDMSYGYGGSIGGIWNINRMFSVAAAYTSKMSMSNLSNYSDLFAENGGFDIPATATYGLTFRPNDSWSLSFDYQDIWYSDVPSVGNPVQYIFSCPTVGGSNAQNCLGGKQGAGFGWRDVAVYKFGGSWKYSDDWTLRAGYSFVDTRPYRTDNNYLSERRFYECNYCETCPLKPQCTKANGNRRIQVSFRLREYQQQARTNLLSERGIELRKQRGVDVETPFGDIKHKMGYRRFLLRGLKKVEIEWGLVCIAHNMRKLWRSENRQFFCLFRSMGFFVPAFLTFRTTPAYGRLNNWSKGPRALTLRQENLRQNREFQLVMV